MLLVLMYCSSNSTFVSQWNTYCSDKENIFTLSESIQNIQLPLHSKNQKLIKIPQWRNFRSNRYEIILSLSDKIHFFISYMVLIQTVVRGGEEIRTLFFFFLVFMMFRPFLILGFALQALKLIFKFSLFYVIFYIKFNE